MTERRLLVNADGFGFTQGVNRGIVETLEFGVVRSVSVNSNFAAVESLPELVRRFPWVSVGVHLNPVVGRPVADAGDVPSLVNRRGEFHYESFVPLLRAGRIDLAELEHELGLQIERVRELGAHVTHLDSHQNTHLWPGFFGVFLRLAQTHDISRMRTDWKRIGVEFDDGRRREIVFYATHPRRFGKQVVARHLMRRARRRGMRLPDRTLRIGGLGPRDRRPMLASWLALANACPPGVSAVHCHPGYVDDELRRWAKVIVDDREDECRALTDPRLRDTLTASCVDVVSFADV